jgi:hypothetical protein
MSRAHPPLHKRRLFTHDGYTVCAVDPLAVRDRSSTDEEFGNFAVHDEFPRLIPEGEIWVSARAADAEGLLFAANALAQLKARKEGAPEERAYDAGENVERFLRHRLRGAEYRAGRPHKRVPARVYVEPYHTLPDPGGPGPVAVWLVDGAVVRDLYKTDYTEGGHGYVYRWVPKGEIWIEANLEKSERPFVVAHESIERRLMRDAGLDYDTAHDICRKLEYTLRECSGPIRLLTPRGRLTKADLPRLADPAFFGYVQQHYLKRRAS